MQEELVRADHARLLRPPQYTVLGHVIGLEAVVVQQEERSYQAGRAIPGPTDVLILRSEDAVVAADRHQTLVLRHAANLLFRPDRPQIMVSRDPDDTAEAARENGEREVEVSERFSDVPGDDQPVVQV